MKIWKYYYHTGDYLGGCVLIHLRKVEDTFQTQSIFHPILVMVFFNVLSFNLE